MEEAVMFTEPAGSYGEAEAGGQMSRRGGDPDVLGSVQGVRTESTPTVCTSLLRQLQYVPSLNSQPAEKQAAAADSLIQCSQVSNKLLFVDARQKY